MVRREVKTITPVPWPLAIIPIKKQFDPKLKFPLMFFFAAGRIFCFDVKNNITGNIFYTQVQGGCKQMANKEQDKKKDDKKKPSDTKIKKEKKTYS